MNIVLIILRFAILNVIGRSYIWRIVQRTVTNKTNGDTVISWFVFALMAFFEFVFRACAFV